MLGFLGAIVCFILLILGFWDFGIGMDMGGC